MVCNYLNHAVVYRQGGANHVHIGCGSGALPLRETTACRWVGCVVVECVGGGISMGRAVKEGSNRSKIIVRGYCLHIYCITVLKLHTPLTFD